MLPCSARGVLVCSAALPRGSCWQSRELLLRLSSGALVRLGFSILDCSLACFCLMGMSCCLSALFLPCGEKKKKRACSPFLPWCLLSGSSQHSECKSCSADRVPGFANPRVSPPCPAKRGAWPCITRCVHKRLSCCCVLGWCDRPAGPRAESFPSSPCLTSSVTLAGISSSARCFSWHGAEGLPCLCGV